MTPRAPRVVANRLVQQPQVPEDVAADAAAVEQHAVVDDDQAVGLALGLGLGFGLGGDAPTAAGGRVGSYRVKGSAAADSTAGGCTGPSAAATRAAPSWRRPMAAPASPSMK